MIGAFVSKAQLVAAAVAAAGLLATNAWTGIVVLKRNAEVAELRAEKERMGRVLEEERRIAAEDLAEAERLARQKEQTYAERLAQIEADFEAHRSAAAADADRARRAVRGLRERAAAFAADAAARDDGGAGEVAAAACGAARKASIVLADMLGRLGEGGAAVARFADAADGDASRFEALARECRAAVSGGGAPR